jgi:hypothetical protein
VRLFCEIDIPLQNRAVTCHFLSLLRKIDWAQSLSLPPTLPPLCSSSSFLPALSFSPNRSIFLSSIFTRFCSRPRPLPRAATFHAVSRGGLACSEALSGGHRRGPMAPLNLAEGSQPGPGPWVDLRCVRVHGNIVGSIGAILPPLFKRNGSPWILFLG